MLINKIIHTKNLIIKDISSYDVKQRYLLWLKNKQVIRFLDQDKDFYAVTLKDLRKNVIYLKKSKNDFLLKMMCKYKKKHIGNIRVGPIHWKTSVAHLGIIIGDTNYWGKRLGAEAEIAVTNYFNETFNLKIFFSGRFKKNIATKKMHYAMGAMKWRLNEKNFSIKQIKTLKKLIKTLKTNETYEIKKY